jgi:hypothetical protein
MLGHSPNAQPQHRMQHVPEGLMSSHENPRQRAQVRVPWSCPGGWTTLKLAAPFLTLPSLTSIPSPILSFSALWEIILQVLSLPTWLGTIRNAPAIWSGVPPNLSLLSLPLTSGFKTTNGRHTSVSTSGNRIFF